MNQLTKWNQALNIMWICKPCFSLLLSVLVAIWRGDFPCGRQRRTSPMDSLSSVRTKSAPGFRMLVRFWKARWFSWFLSDTEVRGTLNLLERPREKLTNSLSCGLWTRHMEQWETYTLAWELKSFFHVGKQASTVQPWAYTDGNMDVPPTLDMLPLMIPTPPTTQNPLKG